MGFVDTGSAWMAGGEPLAPLTERDAVASRFVAAADQAGRRAAFFATDASFGDPEAGPTPASSSQPHSMEFGRLRLGEQPVWDPTEWESTVAVSRSLRSQLRRAEHKGVSVRRVVPNEVAPGTPLRAALDALVVRWKASRAMAEMGYLVQLEPFVLAEERMIFVAERDGSPVAFLSMAPVYARAGWLFEDLLRESTAPNGTSELLVDAGMRALAASGCRWATLGLAPLAGDVQPLLVRIRSIARPLFNFNGLYAFKAKLKPARWESVWLTYPASRSAYRALLDALVAFAGGSLLGFGLRTLWRGPKPVLAAMAALLVPWTVVLLLLPTDRWYPAPWMQWGWAGFDAALCVLIGALAYKWRPAWGVVAAVAVTADVLLTGVQAVVWYLPRVQSAWDVLWTAVACCAPALASVVLWGTVRRQRRARAHPGA